MARDEAEKVEVDGPEDDKSMSFWEHLDELRRRITRVAIAFVIAIFAMWGVKDRLLAFLYQPFADAWKRMELPGTPQWVFHNPSDIFMAEFKVCMIAGLGVTLPVAFYQLWAFVAPGLYRKEKKWAALFVFFTTLFFLGGAAFGWKVAFPITFEYFFSLTKDAATTGVTVAPMLTVEGYLDFVLQLLLAFGIIFELPLLLTALSMVGLVNYLMLWRFGRWFIMIAAILGAVFSPPDTTSMVVMTVPLIVLYFISIGLVYVLGKRPTQEQIERDRRWRAERKQRDQELREAKRRAEAELRARAAETAKKRR